MRISYTILTQLRRSFSLPRQIHNTILKDLFLSQGLNLNSHKMSLDDWFTKDSILVSVWFAEPASKLYLPAVFDTLVAKHKAFMDKLDAYSKETTDTPSNFDELRTFSSLELPQDKLPAEK